MPLPDPMHYLLRRGGRVCISLWLRCSWESPLPSLDSQNNTPEPSLMLWFLGFITSGQKLFLSVDL